MTIEIRVPKLPESVSDATLVAWRRKPGEAVGRDENLADLETDKVVLEVPAPAAGVLREIRVNAGATVRSGDLLALVEPVVAAAPAAAPAPAAVAAAATPGAAVEPRLSPSVRRLVEENRLDPTGIEGSGRDGRLTKSDVVGHLERARAAGVESAPPPAAPAPAPAPAAAPAPVPAPSGAAGPRGEQRVPMTRLRQRIAERLVQVQRTAALLTTFNEVDLSAVNALRARYKDRFEKEHGVKLGYMSFFVKASVEALRRFPIVNASVEGNDIVYHEYYDVGVAVSTDRGLVVPVVRDADQLGFAEIERRISDFGARARAGSLSLEELTGGTFTITNGGVFGSMLSTPIVNAPQSAILGMHSIRERPVVVDGQVVVRPMMYLALSYDHRIIDGRDSVQFLVALKDALEDPGRMLLGI